MYRLHRAARGLRVCGRRRLCTARQPGSRTALEQLHSKIKLTGPLSVASYMKECLLHPVTGYYMQKDVFGAKGDFTTSPEISQVFGELIAVWMLADWLVSGEPNPCHLVELGPGRGTLANDMLRVFGQFSNILNALSLHLVEASPELSNTQEDVLTGRRGTTTANTMWETVPYKTVSLKSGVEVAWYQTLDHVPSGYSYIIAHEFFDALPVHQFAKTPSGWREVLVDIDPTHSDHTHSDHTHSDHTHSDHALRFVKAPGPTSALAAYSSLLPPLEGEREEAEVCPEGLVLAKGVARRVVEGGGAALIADYGEEEVKGHTLRSFKRHKHHDVLVEPGTADITADVDFGAIRRVAVEEGAGCSGPMTQNQFLHKMGVRQRIQALLKGADPEQARHLLTSYEMLTSPEKMGERFKFLTITSSPQHIPTPFTDVEVFPEDNITDK